MVRVPSPLRMIPIRTLLTGRMIWRTLLPRPEERSIKTLRVEQGLRTWDERCLAVAEYHWAIVQGKPDARGPLDPTSQEPG